MELPIYMGLENFDGFTYRHGKSNFTVWKPYQ